MRVLLIYPNAYKETAGFMDRAAITEPLALEYVAAGAELDGHEVKLLDLRLHVGKLEQTLAEYRPDVVAVTGFTMHVLRNLEICASVKRVLPHCKTAVGGIHATLEPVDFFEPQMDYVFVGEGVQAFRQVLHRLEKGDPVRGVPGVYSRVGDTFEWGGDPPPFDMKALPVPDRSLAPEDRSEYVIDYMKPIALMRTSVGCPFRCSFCAVWRIMGGRYYERDLDEVIEELKSIPENYVHLADDEPFVNAARMKEMADRIKQEGIEKEYYCYCRIGTFLKNRELMEQWAAVGLRLLFIGVESIFEHELTEYNKRQRIEEIIAIHRMAKELGIGLYSGFIVHPSYTEKEFTELRKFIVEHGIEFSSFTVWTPMPGIEDALNYENVIRRQKNGRPMWSEFDFQHPVIETALPRHEFLMNFGRLYTLSKHGQMHQPRFEKGATPLPTPFATGDVQTVEEMKKQACIRLAKMVLDRY